MMDYKSAVSKAYCDIPYDELKPLLNSECWMWVNTFKRYFPDVEIKEEDFDFSIDHRLRPKALRNILDNGGWKSTGCHNGSKKNLFVDGKYYHIGFLNSYGDGKFVYQGILKYDGGFKDEAGYPLRPFPTHYIEITQPRDAVYL